MLGENVNQRPAHGIGVTAAVAAISNVRAAILDGIHIWHGAIVAGIADNGTAGSTATTKRGGADRSERCGAIGSDANIHDLRLNIHAFCDKVGAA
jgi:hypothetical protein